MSVPVTSAPIFIGGAPRSGTTLLRAIINASGKIVCGPEARVVPALCSLATQIENAQLMVLSRDYGLRRDALETSFARAIQAFLTPLARDGLRIAEKTPANALHFAQLRRLFPESPLVTIIRDPRDVVASLLRMDWTDTATGAPMAITRDPAAAARLWTDSVSAALEMAQDSNFFALRYETLAHDPHTHITRLFEFLGEPEGIEPALLHHARFNPGEGEAETSAERVAQPIDPKACGRWKQDLTSRQCAIVESIAGPLMRQLDYA